MTRITTPFGFHSTASDVLRGVGLSGQQRSRGSTAAPFAKCGSCAC
jgi:hypothetical protein